MDISRKHEILHNPKSLPLSSLPPSLLPHSFSYHKYLLKNLFTLSTMVLCATHSQRVFMGVPFDYIAAKCIELAIRFVQLKLNKLISYVPNVYAN